MKIQQCPVCDSFDIEDFLKINQVPVYCNVLWPTRQQALVAPRGDLALCFCRACGHVFNRQFDPGLVDYTAEYENSLHYSPKFREYAESLAQELIARHDLHGKTIVEIACGKGDFLRMLCQLGGNQGYGFDPSYEPDRDEAPLPERIQFVRDYYGPAFTSYEADFICCRHALEHIPQATTFLRELRASIGECSETVIFFEVPNSLYSLRDLGIWDFIYEHPSYFCAGSLAQAFSNAGFEVLSTREVYGDQFLCIEVRPWPKNATETTPAPESEAQAGAEAVARYIQTLPAQYVETVKTWRERLTDLAATGRTAVVWGGGSKGVTFLNIMQAGDEVSCVVDINPHKQGKFVAGTGHQIVAPEALDKHPPAVIIVMNPLYRDEIEEMVGELGVEAEIVGV